MSDYTQITDFSAKDSLTTGDPEKIILGADFDGEFAAIETAISTKYDSGDIATSIQATAGLLDTVLMTPLQVDNVLAQNSAVVKSALSLADPAADRILFWDDGAAAGSEAAWLTVTNGLEISGTDLQIASTAAGAGLALSAGVLSVDPGEAALVTVASTDRVLLGDASSSNAFSYCTFSSFQSALSITESQISDLGSYISSGDTVASLTITSATLTTASVATLTETLTSTINVANITESQDGILITDNGNVEVMPWNNGGVHVELFSGAVDVDDTMYGLYMLNHTSGTTLTFNSATNSAHTGACILIGDRDGDGVTLAVGGTTIFNSNIAQNSTASRTLAGGGTCLAIHIGTDDWQLVGDIS